MQKDRISQTYRTFDGDMMRLLTFFALLSLSRAQDLTCFESGECTQSLNLGDSKTLTVQDCLEQCQADLSCQYFTYYEGDEDCFTFANCDILSSETCEDCYSGQRECEDLQCWVPGRCDGVLVDQLNAGREVECHQMCRDNESCLWFTFNTGDSECLLFDTCSFIDPGCITCTSGQVQCTTKKDATRVAVIGGFSPGLGHPDCLDDTEIIDLSGDNNIGDDCGLSNALFPVPTEGATAAVFRDEYVIVCGGQNDDSDTLTSVVTDICYAYDPVGQEWYYQARMPETKVGLKSSKIQGLWFLTGGYHSGNYMTTTEIWDGAAFTAGPELPEPMHEHCQLTLNSTHILFINVLDTGNVFLLDWEDSTWTQLDGISPAENFVVPACGVAYSESTGVEVVVVGGGTSQIFSLDSLSWRSGPTLEVSTAYPVPAQLQNTFVVMGGLPVLEDGSVSYDGTVDDVFRFDPEGERFERLTQRLQLPRSYASAVPLPEDFAENCVQ